MKFKFFILLFLLVTMFGMHGMSIDKIDADFIKKNGFMRYKHVTHYEYHYIEAYDLFGLTWFTRTHKLKEYSIDRHTLFHDPLNYCLKTKVLIASILLPAIAYTGYTICKQLKK